ncbi:hypothetical protein K2173_014919 [Erythroxylum novogranatense]|uniref:Alkane hydroxylase MAH1-like n=1 Tax=Erythroxylum novogranatense TaxID=1862640 RepID=A0AAV8TG68_9ROSI|nr:hypothetical protein K2173_014919 [Erythroxylum novogranatense]
MCSTISFVGDVLVAVACFLFLVLVLPNFSSKNGLPRNWPLVGMLPTLLLQAHRIHDWITEVIGRSWCSFEFKGPWFSNMDMLMTVDPANIHYVMSSNFSNFPKGSEFKEIFDILGDGIFNADSDLWKSQRRTAQDLMTRRMFLQYLAKNGHEKVKKGLVSVLDHVAEEELVVDMQDVFQRYTFDSTCKMIAGYDPECLSIEFPEVAFANALDDAEEAILYRHILPESIWKLQRWLGVGLEKKLRKAWETLDRAIAGIVSTKKSEFNHEDTDMLTSYMKGVDGLVLEVDDKFLRDTILNFLIAGRDTTSVALTWFFWLLSKNPEAVSKIREELGRATPPESSEQSDRKRIFETRELKHMVYLHGALCEALRLYPPVPFQHKLPVKEDTLPSGHTVNPKTKILFSLYAMARMSSIWGDDCLEFKPERWISEHGGIKHEPSYRFLAFNAGPRTCLGKEVAFIQMKAVAATIIYNYDVHVADEQIVSPSVSIILHMKHGLKVRIAKRWG